MVYLTHSNLLKGTTILDGTGGATLVKIYQKIQTMNITEMADYFQEIFDINKELFGCGSCINYNTHHYPEDCIKDNCEWLNVGTSIEAWLKSEYITKEQQ